MLKLFLETFSIIVAILSICYLMAVFGSPYYYKNNVVNSSQKPVIINDEQDRKLELLTEFYKRHRSEAQYRCVPGTLLVDKHTDTPKISSSDLIEEIDMLIK